MPAEKHCLILAAGFGTRMGAIGAQLPKVMWPVFECSLLELQLRFARRLGYENIWINLHHQADAILERSKKREVFRDVRWLRESPEILDIGGGIHNLAAQPEVQYRGELLVLNADQFLWFTAEDLARWKANAGDWGVLLLNWMVNTDDGYNQVESSPARDFLRVVKNAQLARGVRIETYSGNSLVNLEALRKSSGPSAFFDTICQPQLHRCKTALLNDGKYWDFGTATRYWESMQGILRAKASGAEDAFTLFLSETGAFDPRKLDRENLAYGCHRPRVIHLGTGPVAADRAPGVVLEGVAANDLRVPFLQYNAITQAL